MFRKEARNASFFIALLYVCLAHDVIVHLCMRAGSDNMIQFVNSMTLPYLEIETILIKGREDRSSVQLKFPYFVDLWGFLIPFDNK